MRPDALAGCYINFLIHLRQSEGQRGFLTHEKELLVVWIGLGGKQGRWEKENVTMYECGRVDIDERERVET